MNMNEFCVEKLPRVLRIEPSAICNLRCRHCPTGTNPIKISPGIMNMETFYRIIDQVEKSRCVDVVVLYHGGEPFLNKSLLQMAKIVKDLGIRFVKTVTNGMLIKQSDLENILDSGLDSIEFSLDGLSSQENNEIRIGSDYHKVMNTIKELIELRDKRGSVTPEVFIANVQIPTEETIRNNTPIRPPKYIVDDLTDCKDKIEYKCFYMIKWPGFDVGSKYKLVEPPQSSGHIPANECNHIVETVTIRSNGDVVPCCYDLSNQYVIANILDQTLEEIWNNDKYLILRKSIREGDYLPLCENCSVIMPQLHVCKARNDKA